MRKEHNYKGEKNNNDKYLSISLNVNVLNAPNQRHRVAEWIKKHNLLMLPTRDPPQNERST